MSTLEKLKVFKNNTKEKVKKIISVIKEKFNKHIVTIQFIFNIIITILFICSLITTNNLHNQLDDLSNKITSSTSNISSQKSVTSNISTSSETKTDNKVSSSNTSSTVSTASKPTSSKSNSSKTTSSKTKSTNSKSNTSKTTNGDYSIVITDTSSDLELLACVMYQEAGGSCDECVRRVGDVVLNRVNDSRFPNTIKGVLTAKNQYGRFYYTGVKWPSRAKNYYEKKYVARAYRIAEEVLNGQHSELYGKGYVWQAAFKQGKGQIKCCGEYFGK